VCITLCETKTKKNSHTPYIYGVFGTADCSRMESLQQGKILDFYDSTVWFGQIQARKETFSWVPREKCFLSKKPWKT